MRIAGFGRRFFERHGGYVCAHVRLAGLFFLKVVLVAGGMGCGSAAVPSPQTGGPGAPSVPVVTVAVSGPSTLHLKVGAQFTARVTGTAHPAVTWQVNGVAGGSAATGTISASGLYTAPATMPTSNVVTVQALNTASGVMGGAGVSLLNPNAVLTSGTSIQSGVSTTYTIHLTGKGILPGAQIVIAKVAIPTTYLSATAITGTATIPGTAPDVEASVMNPLADGMLSNAVPVRLLHALVTPAAAARLLDQATFGPRLSDIQNVQQVGLDGYLTQQFALPTTKLTPIPASPYTICTYADLIPCEESEWWQAMLTAPDQLRMRVAFALSEMFVVSTDSVDARAVATFQNTLAADAFGNWSTLMKDVALSPAMGAYLNMLNSAKAPAGQIANENFAREMMQLFTTGIDELNPDGTLMLDGNGNPIPVYTEAQVQAFARVYTGWTYAKANGSAPAIFPNSAQNFTMPMAAVESAHDMTAKTLLNGTVLPAGQTAEQDLAEALANLFAQPNVGPFVCRQLIQHLVSSQPSPAYVARVAAVFANDGQGVRGDMQAVIRAILEDAEARAGDTNPNADGGHLREALLWMTNVLRNLGAVNTSSVGDYSGLSGYTTALGEEPYAAPSVFNFFTPQYLIPGTSINAPEFGQENTASAILRLSLADTVVQSRVGNFKIDLSATSPLGQQASWSGVAAVDAGNLVDQLGLMFLHGQMPAAMRTAIVNQVAGIADVGQRVRMAAYLVMTASQYKVEN